MSSILLYGEGKGWLRVKQGRGCRNNHFELFYATLHRNHAFFGYHLMTIDTREAAAAWMPAGKELPVDMSTIPTIEVLPP